MAQRKKILITGACGFVGSNLVRHFLNTCHVRGCDDLSFGRIENVHPSVQYDFQDFNDYKSSELAGYDYIIHGATCNIIFAQDNPVRTIQVNDVNTCEFFSKVPHSTKIIYLSTASVYGDNEVQPLKEDAPIQLTNVYAMSKLAGEEHLKNVHTSFVILRLSNVYGPFQNPENPYCGVMGKLLNSAMTGSDFFVYGDGSATRDYTYVGDVCKAVEAAMKSPYVNGLTLNIATCTERNTTQLVNMVRHVEGAVYFPVRKKEKRRIDTVARRCLDAALAARTMGWQYSMDVFSGMQRTFNWLKENS